MCERFYLKDNQRRLHFDQKIDLKKGIQIIYNE